MENFLPEVIRDSESKFRIRIKILPALFFSLLGNLELSKEKCCSFKKSFNNYKKELSLQKWYLIPVKAFLLAYQF